MIEKLIWNEKDGEFGDEFPFSYAYDSNGVNHKNYHLLWLCAVVSTSHFRHLEMSWKYFNVFTKWKATAQGLELSGSDQIKRNYLFVFIKSLDFM